MRISGPSEEEGAKGCFLSSWSGDTLGLKLPDLLPLLELLAARHCEQLGSEQEDPELLEPELDESELTDFFSSEVKLSNQGVLLFGCGLLHIFQLM